MVGGQKYLSATSVGFQIRNYWRWTVVSLILGALVIDIDPPVPLIAALSVLGLWLIWRNRQPILSMREFAVALGLVPVLVIYLMLATISQ